MIKVGVISFADHVSDWNASPVPVNESHSLLALFQYLKETWKHPKVEFFAITLESLKEEKAPEEFKEIEILFCDPPLLAPHLQKFPKLKWFSSTFAGVNPLPSLPIEIRKFTLTRMRKVYDRPIAEYVIGYIIAFERNVIGYHHFQQEHVWNYFSHYRLMTRIRLGVMGVSGEIGTYIARFAKALGMQVIGYTRSPKKTHHENGKDENNQADSVDKYYHGKEALAEFLREVDSVVAVLPSTQETRGLLDNDVLQEAKRCPVLINVGRGDLISEEAIIKALDHKWIRQAILDVAPIEPLPSSSPLWDRKDITITPHVSGLVFAEDVGQNFLENLQRYLDGKPLENVVDWENGY